MIKPESIEEVRQKADIDEVIGKFVVIKKGMACCPFHGEKTPSFHIWKNKQLFKCFGCGASGDTIGFIMKHERLTFTEAIEWLAAHYNINLEYDNVTREEVQEQKDKKEECLQLIAWAHEKYRDMLNTMPAEAQVFDYMERRGYERHKMQSWDMGVAPADSKFLTTPVINMGKHAPAVDCGLIYSSEGRSWDFYRSRVIIPIHDVNGVMVGLAGRHIPDDSETDRKAPKWMNPPESIIYNKKKVWYGLWQAQRAIREREFAYVVEGYMDVQQMHDADMVNTIAASGTEIDELQAKLLKRYTDHIVLLYDGDKAGTDKAMKQINTFLKLDFKTSIVHLPEGADPDEYIRSYQTMEE